MPGDLADLLLPFARCDDVAAICSALAESVRRATGATFAVAAVEDPEERYVDAFGSEAAPWRFVARLQGALNRRAVDGDARLRAMFDGERVILGDIAHDEAQSGAFGRLALDFGVCGAAATPLGDAAGCAGSVIACYSGANAVSGLRDDLVTALVAHAGASLQRARRFEALRTESERSYALIAESAEGICTFDRELHVGLWNKAAERITGVSRDEVAGKSLAAAGLRPSAPGFPAAFKSFADAAAIFVDEPGRAIEISVTKPGGEEVWISLAGALTGTGARRQSLACCFRDITEQKQLERLRRSFVSLVTHQLRTPLTAIRGYAELLGTLAIPPDQVREYGGVIAGAAARLGDAITDVMDFERLAASRDGLRLAVISLDEALRGALDSVTIPASHSIKVGGEMAELKLEADADRLSRLFAHLIANAVRYWPAGGEIEVEAAREDGFVRCSVIDHGPGIDAAEHAELFSPYHRAARKHPAPGQGLGIGLSLAKRIAEAHRGRIALAQTPGGGATVTVWLPSI